MRMVAIDSFNTLCDPGKRFESGWPCLGKRFLQNSETPNFIQYRQWKLLTLHFSGPIRAKGKCANLLRRKKFPWREPTPAWGEVPPQSGCHLPLGSCHRTSWPFTLLPNFISLHSSFIYCEAFQGNFALSVCQMICPVPPGGGRYVRGKRPKSPLLHTGLATAPPMDDSYSCPPPSLPLP